MWNRNGREIGAQSETYNSVYFRDTFRDLDIFTLQISSILTGPYQFLLRTLKKFELYDFFTNSNGTILFFLSSLNIFPRAGI